MREPGRRCRDKCPYTFTRIRVRFGWLSANRSYFSAVSEKASATVPKGSFTSVSIYIDTYRQGLSDVRLELISKRVVLGFCSGFAAAKPQPNSIFEMTCTVLMDR